MDFTKPILPPNPKARANPVSKVLFLWLVPLFKKGYNKELEVEDLYDILEEDGAEHLGDKLERYWELELQRSKLNGKKPSLFRALVKLGWKTFFWTTCIYFINQALIVSQPVILRLLIATFNEKNPENWKKWTYAGLLSLVVFLNTLVIHPVVLNLVQLAMKLRVATSSLIYRKSLKLSKSAQHQTNSGQIINLLSNDLTRLDLMINFLPFIITAPLVFVSLMYLLFEQIGPACFAGVAFIVLILPMQYYIGKYAAIFRLRIAKRTDERGKFMNEIIIGMRVIKQYAWEKPFSILIRGIRKLEVVELRKRCYIRGLHAATIFFSPRLVQYLTFLLFVILEDEPMTSDKVFFTLACLHSVCQITIHFAPIAAAGLGELIVSIKRVQEFLLLEEQKSNNNILMQNLSLTFGEDKKENNFVPVSMKNVTASWTVDKVTLENVSFSLQENKLMMVVGAVGSSKTSLLHAIIDELPISSGTLSVNGITSYATQEPWIFSGNIRQNILFGLEYEEKRYNEIIGVCALQEDLKEWPYGDLTIVGERGVALSGGQKARVSLARALYREADIYLMDDPLSAVDTKVSRHLFEKCIRNYLRNSTRILVTHQLQYLPYADHILVLDKGKVLAQGTFEELSKAGIDFAGLIASNEEAINKKLSNATPVDKPEEKKEEKKPEENKESKSGGAVTGKTYWEYFMTGHSLLGFIGLSLTFILAQVCMSGNDWWLSYWTNAEAKRVEFENNCQVNSTSCEDEAYLGESTYLYVYSGLALGVLLTNCVRGFWFFLYLAKTSVTIHDKMFGSLVRAPIKFFDDNPSGRIMNRFTKDIGAIDELLPMTFVDTITIFLQVIGVVSVVIVANYYMSVPTVILFIILYFCRKVFVETARDVKRIESITRSPVFTHVAATLQGLTTIRACRSQAILTQQFEGHQDIHSSTWFLFMGANRAFGMWLELISDVFVAITTFSFLIISTSDEGGNVGLAIASLLTLMGAFQWGMRQSAETENYMTSVERALEYSNLKPEAELESNINVSPPLGWPTLGQIEFVNLSLSYEADKPVLKNLSFKINPSEKIGIVGRTGAGKSSIIAALFRLTEPTGEIYIDGVKVNDIGLHDLRKKISIIPQDPVLFSGTIRYNLDPFNQFNDSDLWRVIEEVELKDAVSALDFHVEDGGANFSVGQRQLVCLARAILRNNKILVLDEATANIDYKTDGLIQQTIRSKFANFTVITIAHRLHSIIDCDRILVLDHGVLMESDHPHILLENNGIFAGMVMQTGPSTSAMLRKSAHEAFTNKSRKTYSPPEHGNGHVPNT